MENNWILTVIVDMDLPNNMYKVEDILTKGKGYGRSCAMENNTNRNNLNHFLNVISICSCDVFSTICIKYHPWIRQIDLYIPFLS